MTDSQLQILHAFLFALAQQDEPLSDTVQDEIRKIAQSLEERVRELDSLATSDRSLAIPYDQAMSLFVEGASQQLQGFDPDIDGEAIREQSNQVSDDSAQITETIQFLKAIQQKYREPAQAASVLTAKNPVQFLKQFLLTLRNTQTL